MATYYASKSADNGYVVGNDANSGLSKALPKLTVRAAQSTAVADGDIVIINGGAVGNPQTYLETAVMHPANALTMYPDPTGASPTIQNNNIGADGWIFTTATSKVTTLGAIGSPQLIWDSQSVAATRCVVCNATSTGLVILNNTFNNWTTEALYLQPGVGGLVSALVQGCVFNGSGSAGAGVDAIVVNVIATDVVTIRSCTFACGAVAKSGFNAITVATNAAASVLNVDHCSFTYNLGGAFTANGIQWANLPGTLNATNNAFSGSLTGTGNTWRGIYTGATAAAMTLTAKGNTYTLTAVDNNTAYAIFTVSNGVVDIENESCTYTPSGVVTILSGCNGIRRDLPTAGTSPLTIIRNCVLNIFNANVPPDNGIGIWVGSNNNTGQSNPYSLANVIVSGNVVTGGNHGILVGWVGGALIWGNRVVSTDGYQMVLKDTQGAAAPNLVFVNVFDSRGPTLQTGTVLGKGANADKVFNNLILKDSQTPGVPVFLMDAQGFAAGSNVQFVNNLVYWVSGVPTSIVVVKDTSTASFQANAYYAAAGNISGSAIASYQGITYGLADWIAKVEPSGFLLTTDPLVSLAAGDYRLKAQSNLYRAGVFVDYRATDWRGRPFWVPPSVGIYEVTARDPARQGF